MTNKIDWNKPIRILGSRIDDNCLGGIKITVFDNGEFKVKKIK